MAIIVARAKAQDHIKGEVPQLVNDSLSILQYADNVVNNFDHDVDHARNSNLAQFFGCQTGAFPRYLGILIILEN